MNNLSVNNISYDDHITSLTKQLQNQNYTFEITKCCNYSTFVLVNRSGTLLDLFKATSLHFDCPDIKSLYVVNTQTNEKLRIPLTDTVKISKYILDQPREFFTPVYPVPRPVVYRVYLDDGHWCMNHSVDLSNNAMDMDNNNSNSKTT
jgi:hypothetical protein